VRALVSVVVVAFTVVLQLTVVDRIAFPGGAGPNLVLLVVAALALAGGPMAGVLTGFLAGLALDVAPPGSHFVGQNALVFCLVGYACGLLAEDTSDAEQGHTALFEIVVTAAGAVLGEALLALLGVMLSDPRVTWPAIKHVLPVAVAYDVLLCPFVLYAVAAALRLGGARREARRPGLSPSQARTPVPGTSQGAIRQLAGGSTPRLWLSERDKGTASIGGLRGTGSVRPAGRREPQLKLGRTGQRTLVSLGAAFAPAAFGAGTVRVKFGGSNMGRSLLGGSVFGRRPSSPLNRQDVFGRPAALGMSSPLRRRRDLAGGGLAGGGLAGSAPRFSRGGSLARLTASLRRSGPKRPKSPGRGWLRGVSSRSGSPRGNTLGGASMRRRALGGRRTGRSLAGRGSTGRSLGGRGLTGHGFSGRGLSASRTPRLRMPRPKTGRKWRTGGYR
jgi:rod shape-determining protein MreD